MAEILNIQSGVVFDESIAHYEIHAHQPYTSSSFNNSDEVRISIQNQDQYILPSKSALHVCGRITKEDNTAIAHTKLVNNAIAFLFEDLRYEINAVEIDRCRNVGLTSLIKGWISLSPNQNILKENAGWLDVEQTNKIINNQGYFDISIPLSMLFGFAEDYHKIVVNTKHELILTRTRNDYNAVVQELYKEKDVNVFEDFKIKITKIEWLMPYVILSDEYKLRTLKYIEKDPAITMCFRSWELYEYPALPTTSKHIWSVKTSNQLEKPRYVIVGFQTQRKGRKNTNSSYFDHCNISNVKLFLNSQYYPYGNMNININNHQFAVLYNMYAAFQSSYYEKEAEPLLTKSQFINYLPLIVIDCSKQNEALKSGAVDVRLEFESRENFDNQTAAYCLILHDRIVQYKPISGDVKKLV